MEKIIPFKELEFLFNNKSRHIIRLNYNEAKYLYNLIKSLKSPSCVEIGRLQGGSLLTMAYAGGNIISIDLQISSAVSKGKGKLWDSYCLEVLRLVGLQNKVKIIIGNSQTWNTKFLENKINVLFIDGDHSYEGVKNDYNNWINTVKLGGHILFHDACGKKENIDYAVGVKKFVNTLTLKKVKEIESIAHFIKGEN